MQAHGMMTGPISAQAVWVPGNPSAWTAAQVGRVKDWHSLCPCTQTVPIYHTTTQRRYYCAPAASPRHAVVKDWPSRSAHGGAISL